GEHALDHGQVGTAGEGGFSGGEDDALDGLVGGGGVKDLLDLVHHLDGEDVHGLVRHVPGDENDAIGVGFDGEVLVGAHDGISSSLKSLFAAHRSQYARAATPRTMISIKISPQLSARRRPTCSSDPSCDEAS